MTSKVKHEILNIPAGETRESFLECRLQYFMRLHDLYKFITNDLHCYDYDLQTNIISVELMILNIIDKLKELK